ncbi:3-deoxy-manno-octulosonate cytidylyltransferase [Alkalimarinus coralli]|uniref:3-deoxy-manno-octulosonate cytidylyltransferase n=1 Tax=Alkalimarinus coralli TaxID=2935863 RepID=UPI00202B7194|nr:3-deoxy-manno-octulosonate cytidylyltransferase [Alkalimarinus coralli]
MSFSVVIPARYASSRLPGKPLLDIAGKPMIQHVYEQACLSEAQEVIVATDDERIRSVCEGFGAKVVMTSPDHPSGTDRLEEVVSQLGYYLDDIVVNVQGDEPLIPPRIINQVAHNLAAEQTASIATLCEDIGDLESVLNPNVVKVVFDEKGLACYFSRAPIPWARDHFGPLSDIKHQAMPDGVNYYRHIGIYAYRVKFLKAYVKWDPCPMEMVECLEQLRALWNGEKIHVSIADEQPPAGVDTQEDLDRVRRIIESQNGGRS